LVKLIY
jgi:hypothetical protein